MKQVHKIYEDKIDKLYNEAYQASNVNFEQNEWQTLNKRIVKHNTINKAKKIAAFVTLITLLALIGFKISSTNTKINNATKIKNQIEINSTSSLKSSIETKQKTEAINLNNQNENTNTVALNNSTKNIDVVDNSNNYLPINDKKTNNIFIQKAKSTQHNTHIKKNNNAIVSDTNPLIENSDANISKNNIEQSLDNDNNQINVITNDNEATTKHTTDKANMEIDFRKNAIITSAVSIAKKNKKDKKEFDINFENNNKIVLDIFTGYNYSSKMQNNFTAFLGGNTYTTLRLEQEKSLAAISAGFHVSFYKKNTSFTTGLQFLQQGDDVQYADSTFIKTNGRTHFNYLAVPLLVGKEFVKNRWGFGIKAGVITGLLLSAKGTYASLTNNGSRYDVANNKNDFKKLLFNLTILPQVKYYLNNDNAIFIAPSYLRNLHSITKTEVEFKQRYSVIGLKMGLSVNLK